MTSHNHIPGVLALALFIALAVLMHGAVGGSTGNSAAHLPDGPVAITSLY